MSIFKRGSVYWYKFTFKGEAIRESTRQKNQHVARQMEAAHRASLAKGEVGIREKKIAPTLKELCDHRFEPWAKSTFEKSVKNNWLWFRGGIRALLAFKPLASARLDAISNELAAEFASYRLANDMQVSTVNSSLRVLRRILRLAVEWGVLEAAPIISLLPGERHRETVVTPEQERRYLEHAPEPLRCIATVLADTGLRPDECYSLRWENLNWDNGRNGTLLVTGGKTIAARRVIPMTPRVRFVLETRWEHAQKPVDGWIWSAPTKKGHVDHSSLKKQHARAFANANKETKGPQKLTAWVLICLPPYVFNALGRVRLRCVDASTHRRTQLHCNFKPVRSPIRRCRVECHGAPEWAQNWAQWQYIWGCRLRRSRCNL